MGNIYLITGATGHLGNTLVNMLCERNKKVRVLVLPRDNITMFDNNDIEIYHGDVRDKNSMEDFFKNGEYNKILIHCAGIVSIASKYEQIVYDVNVMGTENVVELSQKYNVKKMIYVSSVHAIKEKPNHQVITEVNSFNIDELCGLYAKTKAIATQKVLESNLFTCVVHPSGIIGPFDYGNGHSTKLVVDYLTNQLKCCVNGGYDFVDVRDVSEGIINCDKYGKDKECYILSNNYYSTYDLLNILYEITNYKKIKIVLSSNLAKFIAPLAEGYYKLLKQTPLFTSYSMYTLTSNSNFSHAKADQELHYKTRNMKDTLTDTITFLKKIKRV